MQSLFISTGCDFVLNHLVRQLLKITSFNMLLLYMEQIC